MHRFFIDRNLGAVMLPGVLRDAGWDVVTLSEHFGERRGRVVTDPEWLELAGQRGWVVLMKDKRIRYRDAEKRALIQFNVRAFCLSSGNLTGSDQAEIFLKHQDKIFSRAEIPGPSLFMVTSTGIRRVDLQ